MKMPLNWQEKLQSRLDSGFIRVANHPTLPLKIYNYTNKATYEELWDEVTTRCRGLVLDNEFNVVIKCPPKFFNHDQIQAPDISTWEHPRIYQKLDGYYISIKDDPKYGLIVTSRGSFDNKYVDAAKKLLSGIKLQKGYTYFCELLQTFKGDEDKILAKYTTPSMRCWAIKDPNHQEIVDFLKVSPFNATSLIKEEYLEDYLKQEVEGVVVFNPETSERIKVKTDWYLLRHRIISNCTPKRVWKILSQGKTLEDYDIPDELLPAFREIEQSLIASFEAIRKKAEDLADEAESLSDKELGLSNRIAPEYKPLVFRIRKDQISRLYEDIWNKIKPKKEDK